jgi:hypothetical protein
MYLNRWDMYRIESDKSNQPLIHKSNHLDDPSAINDARKRFGVHSSVCAASLVKLIPPAKEEVSCNEFEPRGEGITCIKFNNYH